MVSSSSDFPQKSLQIKKDDKFFARLMSKEGSMANPSFRIYYGGVSGAVPFMWESQPGTPKHTFSDSTLPPLTPPPSYQFNSNKKPTKKHSRSSLLHSLFPRLINPMKQNHVSPSSPSSLSLSSSWSSSTTSSMSLKKRSRFSSPRSSFDSMMEYDEEPNFESSHTSTPCFGFGRETSGGSSLKGGCGYSAMSMKKAFLSIVGQGSKLRY